MAYSNPRDRQSGRNNFGRRDFNRPRADRQMFQAVCSECGKDCEVPFKPSGDKPVFCSLCFEQRKAVVDRRPAQNNEQLASLNAKLDKILELLQEPPKKKTSKKTVLPPKA